MNEPGACLIEFERLREMRIRIRRLEANNAELQGRETAAKARAEELADKLCRFRRAGVEYDPCMRMVTFQVKASAEHLEDSQISEEVIRDCMGQLYERLKRVLPQL